MAITTFTENMDILAALDNEPNDVGGLTPEQAKAKFDEAGNTIKDFFNESLIPELDAAHLPYEYGGENTIKDTLDGVVLGTIPDNSLTYEKMNPALKNKLDAIDKNTINLLRLKLQGTLAVPDIDAWCDLFADEKQLNLSGCSDVWADGGVLKTSPVLDATIVSTDLSAKFGETSDVKQAQTFTPDRDMSLTKATVTLTKTSYPTDNVVVSVYATSAGLPTTLIAASTTTLAGGDVSLGDFDFAFSGVSLTAGTVYALVFERSGSLDDSDCYAVRGRNTGSYTGGTRCAYNGTSWSAVSGSDLSFELTGGTDGTAIWTAVTPTEALAYMALTADQDEATGSITWYLSDDGTTWVEVTALDAMQNVAFDAESVYLKCVLTGDAYVSAVAYGGY